MLTEILTVLSAIQHPYFGVCPKDLAMHYIGNQLNGRWYEHSRYPNFLQDSNRCTSVDAESTTSDWVFAYRVNVTNLDRFGKVDVRKNIFLNGFVDIDNLIEDPSISRTLQDIFFFTKFYVLSTDYTNYAIVYYCYEIALPLHLFHFRLVWILTRERKPSAETLQVVHSILTENNLSLEPLIETDQSDCDEVIDDVEENKN